jgi:glycosyltransferase involved in cell wall biosynthesis
LVVTYGWEGLRTWDSGPVWQERCDQVEAEVKGRFAGQNVIFTGRLNKPDLARVLMQSDVCLYPCNFFETFCLTALECQAAGLPMVTSEFGALATTLAPGAGVKIPGHPSSPAYRQRFVRAAVEVLQDADRRRAMGAAGVVHVAGGPFGWLDVAEQWRRLEWEL